MALNLFVLQIIVTLSFSISLPLTNSIPFKYAAVFNFGDSNSDTGNLLAGVGLLDLLNAPYGRSYKPSGRFSDGRLIVDFLMGAMDLPFLNPYLDSIGEPSFRAGCNFAAAGSTIQPATAASFCPFSFGIQVNQFFRFKARVLELEAQKKEVDQSIPPKDYFQKGLYTFDIGQNDLAGAFYSKSFDQIIALIPIILAQLEDGIKRLHYQGGRNFWIHNTGPLGCLAENVARFGTDPSKLDEVGCVISHNQAARIFNQQLHDLCKRLKSQFSDASVTYVDIFTIKYDLIANHSQYEETQYMKNTSTLHSFRTTFLGDVFFSLPHISNNGFQQPIMACCGYGGPPLNFDSRIVCGQTKVLNGSSVTAKGCSNSNIYVNWDGIHYTQAANHHVSAQILTGKYSDPPF